jgi:hypothetical protein
MGDAMQAISASGRKHGKFLLTLLTALVGVVLFILFVCAFVMRRASCVEDTPGISTDALRVDDKYLDLGTAWVSEKLQCEVPITNASQQPVEVLGFEFSCTCAVIEPHTFTLDAGETRKVKVTIDPSRKRGLVGDLASREFWVTLAPRVKSGGEVAHGGWTLHGVIRVPFVMTPGSLSFDDGCIRGWKTQMGRVCLSETLPLASVEAKVDPTLACVKVSELADRPGRYRLEVRPNEWLPRGKFAFDVHIKAITKDGRNLPPIALPVGGRMKEQVEATPDSLSFGARRIGDSAVETIVLQSLVNSRFEVLEADSSLKEIQLTELRREQDDRVSYRVAWRISRLGEQTSVATFMVQSGERRFPLSVRVDSYGY